MASHESWEPPQSQENWEGWSHSCCVILAELSEVCSGLLPGLPASFLASLPLPQPSALHPAEERPFHIISLLKAQEYPPSQCESQTPQPGLEGPAGSSPYLCHPVLQKHQNYSKLPPLCLCPNCALCWERPSLWAPSWLKPAVPSGPLGSVSQHPVLRGNCQIFPPWRTQALTPGLWILPPPQGIEPCDSQPKGSK